MEITNPPLKGLGIRIRKKTPNTNKQKPQQNKRNMSAFGTHICINLPLLVLQRYDFLSSLDCTNKLSKLFGTSRLPVSLL